MLSSNKRILGIFLSVFCLTLAVLGIFQSALGTIRLFNASEEEHESLQTNHTYVLQSTPRTIANILSKTEDKTEKNVTYYILQNKESIESALAKMPPEKSQQTREKIQQLLDNTETKEPLTDQVVTSVTIDVIPTHSKAPYGYEATIISVLTGQYFRDAVWKFPIIIDTLRTSPRWQMKNESITLSTSMTDLAELAKVVVHEFGHMVDIYTLKKKNSTADISQDFYTISWESPTIMHSSAKTSDFVSWYAATNQYEDFAESFTMYIFHNFEFRKRAQENLSLEKKYQFFKKYIFGNTFTDSRYEKSPIPSSLWDVTKITLKDGAFQEVFSWIYQYFYLAWSV